MSATFEVQTLNVLRRHDNVNLEDNSTGSDVINLAPATLQAIGIEVRYDQPIFAKFGFRKPKQRKHHHNAASRAFKEPKTSSRNLIELHCFEDEDAHYRTAPGSTSSVANHSRSQSVARPVFSGYLLRCKDMHKYYSGYQFSIFDWPCERDKAEGTVRKNKLIGIVIGNSIHERRNRPNAIGRFERQNHLMSSSDFSYCSLNYIKANPKSAVIVNFYGENVPLPHHISIRRKCDQTPPTLILLPEYKGGVKPGKGAGIGVFPEMELIQMNIQEKLKQRKKRIESMGGKQSAFLNAIAFAEESSDLSEGPELGQAASEEQTKDMEGGEALDMLEEMLPPLIRTMFEWIMQLFDQKEPHDMSEQLKEDTIEHTSNDFPYDEAQMLAEKVTTAAASTISEALVTGVTEDVVMGINAIIPVYLANGVVRNAEPVLHKAIHSILTESIPNVINEDIPTLVSRSLNIALAELLTRSVTHALVPSLSLALSHNLDQDYYCYSCYYHQMYCRYCHYSPQMTYYNNYYSAYYSDYFSTYYGDYYTKAAQEVDGIEFK